MPGRKGRTDRLRMNKTEDRQILGQRPRPREQRLENLIRDCRCRTKSQQSMHGGTARFAGNQREADGHGKPKLAIRGSC